MLAQALLREAQAAGLQLEARGRRLVIIGPRAGLELLRARIGASCTALLELLIGEAEQGAGHVAALPCATPGAPAGHLVDRRAGESTEPVELPRGADPARPPAGWTWLRSGPLAGCWLGPGWLLVSDPAALERAGRGAAPPAGCACCGSPELVRVETGPEWLCPICHPPLAAIVERRPSATSPGGVELGTNAGYARPERAAHRGAGRTRGARP